MEKANLDFVLDVEATCWENGKTWRENRCEIIEFGITPIKFLIDKLGFPFSMYIKPEFNPTLSDFCKSLTGIQQDTVDNAFNFKTAVLDLDEWAITQFRKPLNQCWWGTWGFYDLKIIQANCEWKSVDCKFALDKHINLKSLIREKYAKSGPFGVPTAMKTLGLEFIGKPHSGRDDSYNIARMYYLADKAVGGYTVKDFERMAKYSARILKDAK